MKKAGESVDDLLRKADQKRNYLEPYLRAKLEELLPTVHVQLKSRVKSKKSLEKKLSSKKKDNPTYTLNSITDLVGFRFVCHFQDDVEKVVRLVLTLIRDGRLIGKLIEPPRLYTTKAHNQDALKASLESLFREFNQKLRHEEKASRYTSIHLLTTSSEGEFPVEVQVRNVFEDAWSEIEHALRYKSEKVLTPSIENHLKVLNSLVQSCTEYAEAIFSDVSKEMPEKASVYPMPSDKSEYPAFIRQVMSEAERLQQKNKSVEAIRRLEGFIRRNGQKVEGDREANYFLNMEIALSYLLHGDLQSAIRKYEEILEIYSGRALIYYRLAEAFRTDGDYRKALDYLRLCQSKIRARGNTKQEIAWLQYKIPVKIAYVMWKLGSTEQALAVLRGSYKKVKRAGDIELRKTFVNSICYYETEIAWKGSQRKRNSLRHWKLELERLGLNSVKNARPESVDTYAWLCQTLGEGDAALRAAREVQSCFKFKKEEIHPQVVWNGKPHRIAESDIDIIRQHIGLIEQMNKKHK